jgi:hypothetical protein
VNVRDRFRELVAGQPAEYAGVELLPVRLARAATELFDAVDGVGISVLAPGLRVPIGASDPDAAAAERLQVTFGEGPCLQAAATGRPVVATPDQYARCWPLLYQELTSRCRYRAVISQPLLYRSVPFGSVDLNLRGARLPTRLWTDIPAVAAEIAAALIDPDPRPDGPGWATPDPMARPDGVARPVGVARPDPPAWLDSPPARHRQQVWIAVGMLTVHLHLNEADALDQLRALAFTHGQDLDRYAADLVHRRVELPDPDP